MTTTPKPPKIVIIGAGFGGLFAARTLAHREADVLLIDRNNYHTFTPLLYQVATAGLDPSEIAYPIRGITRHWSNVDFLMGEVVALDTARQQIGVQANGHIHHIAYDYLILAAGSITHYFGHEEFAADALSLKNLGEAIALRNHILKQFERAIWVDDPQYRTSSATMVVVGGGPTGLETAGALYELSTHILEKEFKTASNPIKPQVILVEAANQLLTPYPPRLQQAAHQQLTSLGVEVILDDPVEKTAPDHIQLRSGRIIPTRTLIWSAGVKSSPLAAMLGVPLHQGRVPVQPTMQVRDLEQVYAVGDLATIPDDPAGPYPQVIPVAKQQGMLAAQNILRREKAETQQPFHYDDRGMMATIGRNRAVAWLYNRIPLTGYLAWLTWLFLHLLWLMGFRNRLNVLVNWVWNYFTYDRSVRIIMEQNEVVPANQADTAPNNRPDKHAA